MLMHSRLHWRHGRCK